MKYLFSSLALIAILALSGCSGRAIFEGEIYYPKENQGNVWQSRAEFHRKSSQTRENMGKYYHGRE